MSLTEQKIKVSLILEVIGRPAEYLIETLNDLIKKIGEEKGIAVKNSIVNPPVSMKEQKDFYTSFAEIELDAEGILQVAILMFKYMPAHLEIISPQNISLTNFQWNDILNELVRRLHGYDELARIMQAEKSILENKLRALMPQEKVEENKEKKPKEENKDKKRKKKK